MQELSDSTSRFIIIIIFVLYIIYLNYQQIQLKMTKNFDNIQCNPLDMIIGGIINEEQASNTFSNCLNYATSENTTKSIKDAQDQQSSDIAEIINNLNDDQKQEYKSQSEEQKELFDLMKVKASNMSDLIVQQQTMNETLVNSSEPIQNMMKQLGELSGKLQNITTNIYNNI